MAPAVPDVPPVHTSTHQWQSFEMRMRQRRIDRLLARGEAALEARDADAAREAIEELDRLDPGSTTVAALRTRLTQPIAEAPVTSASFGRDLELGAIEEIPQEPSRKSGWLTAVAAVILLFGGVAWFAVPRVNQSTFAEDVSQATAAPPSTADATTEPASAAPPAVQVAVSDVTATKTNEEVPSVARDEQPLPTLALAPALPAVPAEATAPRTDARLPAASLDVEVSRASTPPPPVPMTSTPSVESTPREPAPAIPPVAIPPVPIPPVATVSAPAALPETTLATPRTVASDDADIRSTLAQYEAAYSRLDVDAVRTVWPGIDRRALAHAFDGLDSQRVSLGSCAVRIAGETAVAECAGFATWTPKVGGGSRNQPRRWQFNLRNASGSWHIVSATTR